MIDESGIALSPERVAARVEEWMRRADVGPVAGFVLYANVMFALATVAHRHADITPSLVDYWCDRMLADWRTRHVDP